MDSGIVVLYFGLQSNTILFYCLDCSSDDHWEELLQLTHVSLWLLHRCIFCLFKPFFIFWSYKMLRTCKFPCWLCRKTKSMLSVWPSKLSATMGTYLSTDLWWYIEFPQSFSFRFLPFFQMALAVLWIWPQIHDPGFEPLTHTPSAVLIYKNGVTSVLSLVPSKLMKLPASSHHTVLSILLLWNVAGKVWRPFHGSNKNIKISCFSSSGWRKRKAGKPSPPWCYWHLGLDSSVSWGASCPCWLLSSIPAPPPHLDASSTHQVVTTALSPDIVKCLPWRRREKGSAMKITIVW